jgi:hypothetical protein
LSERVAAIGGVVLLVALFLPWYTKDGRHATAWETMSVADILLALAAVGAIAAAVATAARPGAPVPIAFTALASLPATVGLVVAVWRVVSPAPPVDVGLGAGAWLGLAAAVAIAVGEWTGLADEGPERRDEARERTATEAERARAELLTMPPEAGGGA